MTTTNFKTLCFATALAIATNFANAQTTPQSIGKSIQPIIDIVSSKKTPSQLETILKNRGCKYIKTQEKQNMDFATEYLVKPECFKLPGSPSVTFGIPRISQVTESAMVFFDGRNSLFNPYKEALTSKYGTSGQIRQELGEAYDWRRNNPPFYVNLFGGGRMGAAMIMIQSGKLADKFLKERRRILGK